MNEFSFKKNPVKISVITAAWNSGKTIEDTLRSVLNQTYGNVEHIIVDGNSDDHTMDIVKKYADHYRQRGFSLKWISETDDGIYDAMNKGISVASGDVVGLLNSDDFFTTTSVLEKVASEFADVENPVDAVYGDIHYVNPDRLDKTVRYYCSKKFKREWMRMGFMPAHPSFYCRRDIYKKYGLFDTTFKIAADFEQLLRLLYIHQIKARYISLDFVTMRTGGISTSGFSSHIRIYSEHRTAYRKNGVYSNIFLESARYIYKIIQVCKSTFS